MTSTYVPPPTSWLSAPLLRWSIAIVAAVAAGIALFNFLDLPIFRPIGLPHEICYLQQPTLVWLHVTADLLIGIAYVSISATLGYLVYRASHDIPFHWVFLAFGLFIVSCGFTHFMEVLVIWHPLYWLSGYIKVITAAASVATAIALFPLVPKIFALIAAARESEVRRAEIERLNQDLERFNYSVAHDLRAPLRSIVGFGTVLQEDHAAELSPDAQEHLQRILRSATRMDSLVTGLLRYATLGTRPMESQAVALDDAVRNVIALLESDIAERHAQIKIAGALPSVVGDPAVIQTIFQNLIANAIKFVAPGVTPLVSISWSEEGDRAVVHVTDNGIGFPAEARGRVFGLFERFHAEQPGTGIGLAIVLRAVERLHGEVRVDPAPSGTGSRFSVKLPRA